MSAVRAAVLALGVVATVVAVVALVAAARNNVSVTRLTEIPVAFVAFATWYLALRIATKVAHGSNVDGVPGLAQLYGLGAAAMRAPVWSLGLSAISMISIALLGASGRVHRIAVTSAEAQITGSALLGFLLISIPVLASRHPAATSIGSLTTRSSGPG